MCTACAGQMGVTHRLYSTGGAVAALYPSEVRGQVDREGQGHKPMLSGIGVIVDTGSWSQCQFMITCTPHPPGAGGGSAVTQR
jgi:hypothetical protein